MTKLGDKIGSVAMFCLIFLLSVWLLNKFRPYDTTDNEAEGDRSGMILYTDHLTGCQYLRGGLLGGGITPRLGGDGNQICDR